jgi:hypothetical protein
VREHAERRLGTDAGDADEQLEGLELRLGLEAVERELVLAHDEVRVEGDRSPGRGRQRGLRGDRDGETDAADAHDQPLSACRQHRSVEPRDHDPSLGPGRAPAGLPRRAVPADSLA